MFPAFVGAFVRVTLFLVVSVSIMSPCFFYILKLCIVNQKDNHRENSRRSQKVKLDTLSALYRILHEQKIITVSCIYKDEPSLAEHFVT